MPDLTQGSRHTRRRGTQPDGGRFVGDPNAFSGMGTAVPFIQSTLGNLWGEQQLAPLRRVAQTHTIALSLLVDALSPDDVLHHSIRYTLSQMTRYWTAQNTTFGDR